MARDKEWEARMQCLLSAYQTVKEGGLEALEKDIKRRGILGMPLAVSSKEAKKYYDNVSRNVYNNMLTGMLYALHDTFGFGKKRLDRLKAAFDRIVMCTQDLDYMGEHYVKLEDFAIELNEKYELDIDANIVAATQDIFDGRREEFRSCKVDKVIRELRENGFVEAAEFLDRKMA